MKKWKKLRGAAIGLLMGITAGLGLAAAVAAWVHHQPAPKMGSPRFQCNK